MKKRVFALLLVFLFTISFATAACEGTASFESPTSASCSSQFNGWYDCGHLIDDVKTTGWLSGWGDTTWSDLEVVTDLGEEKCINELMLNDWVQTSRTMGISISSDGTNYIHITNKTFTPNNQKGAKISLTETQARYIKFNFEPLGSWFNMAAMKARMSEIKINTRDYEPTSCFDSDGGIEIYAQGYAESSINGRLDDTCLSFSGTDYINESYCDPSGFAYSSLTQCPNGCSNGACNLLCTDSDGFDIFTKGSTSFFSLVGVGEYEEIILEDFCQFGDVVIEYACNGNDLVAENATCANSCVNGACQ